jgi:hypothetical protein
MGILDVHADELINAARNAPRIPPPRPSPKFNAWGVATAAPRGLAAGAAESGGFFADVTGAFGQVLAATDARPGGMFSAESPETERARQKMLREGVDYSSEAGDLLRGVSSGYRPDAATASTAERIVFDFSRVASKAVGYTVAGGPVVGPLLTGADEGMAAADELRQQGVDLATRTKAGAVIGGVTALGVGLPMAGTTLAQTAGLVALGGPISFTGQQAAVRGILQSAGYDKIGEQYDPLDPVGLAVSTLLPAAFGAYGLRRARARAEQPAGGTEVAPQPTEAPAASPETVDAARVALAVEQRQGTSLARPDDLRGQQAHDAALTKAEQQIAAGERVEVSGVAAADRLPEVAAAVAVARAQAIDELDGIDPWDMAPPVVEPEISLRPAPEVADELRAMAGVARWAQEGGRMIRSGIEEPGDGGMGGSVVGRTPWIPAEEWFGRMRAELGRRGLARQSDIAAAVEKAIEGQPLKATEQRTVDWIRAEQAAMQRQLESFTDGPDMARDSFDAGLSSKDAADAALAARAAELDEAAFERAALMHENDDAAFTAALREIVGDGQQASPDADAGTGPRGAQAPAADPAGAARPVAGSGDQPSGGGGRGSASPDAAAAESAAAVARLADIQAQFPDLTVRMDGMDAPMRLSDFLAAVKAQADADLADAPLYQIAAECALLNG